MLGVITGSMELDTALWNEQGKLLVVNRHKESFTRSLPHEICYQSLLLSMQKRGVTEIVAFHTVGGINPAIEVGSLILTTDVIDYTWGRKQLERSGNQHVDVSDLFDPHLRLSLAQILDIEFGQECVMGVTQGPRLETPAEVRRMERDGCDVVGMTAMPEAAIAKQLGIPYASVALVVNRAAGRATKEELTEGAMGKVRDRFTRICADTVLSLLK